LYKSFGFFQERLLVHEVAMNDGVLSFESIIFRISTISFRCTSSFKM
jgi:hypothetical protein